MDGRGVHLCVVECADQLHCGTCLIRSVLSDSPASKTRLLSHSTREEMYKINNFTYLFFLFGDN